MSANSVDGLRRPEDWQSPAGSRDMLDRYRPPARDAIEVTFLRLKDLPPERSEFVDPAAIAAREFPAETLRRAVMLGHAEAACRNAAGAFAKLRRRLTEGTA